MLLRNLWEGLRVTLDTVLGLLPQNNLSLPALNVVLPWPAWVPYEPLATCAVAVVVWIGVLGLYGVFSWIWNHIPTIAGFGTGGG